MGRTLTKGGFEVCPEGTFPARLRTVACLGFFEDSFRGKLTERVGLEWLCHTDGGVQYATEILTLSFSSQSKLYARAKVLLRCEPEQLDLETLLNREALVTVEHKAAGDKTRAVITAVGPMPASLSTPALDETSYYDDAEPDYEIYEKLPKLFTWMMQNQQKSAPGMATESADAAIDKTFGPD